MREKFDYRQTLNLDVHTGSDLFRDTDPDPIKRPGSATLPPTACQNNDFQTKQIELEIYVKQGLLTLFVIIILHPLYFSLSLTVYFILGCGLIYY